MNVFSLLMPVGIKAVGNPIHLAGDTYLLTFDNHNSGMAFGNLRGQKALFSLFTGSTPEMRIDDDK